MWRWRAFIWCALKYLWLCSGAKRFNKIFILISSAAVPPAQGMSAWPFSPEAIKIPFYVDLWFPHPTHNNNDTLPHGDPFLNASPTKTTINWRSIVCLSQEAATGEQWLSDWPPMPHPYWSRRSHKLIIFLIETQLPTSPTSSHAAIDRLVRVCLWCGWGRQVY